MYCIKSGINCLVVHLYDSITLLRVRLLSCLLHELYSVIDRHYVSQLEECRLKNCVGTLTHTDLDCLIDCIDRVKLNIVVSDIFLCLSVEMLIKLLIRPLAVDHEYSARLNILNHLHALDNICRVVACYEVSLVNVVWASDWVVTKSQVRNCNTTGLL